MKYSSHIVALLAATFAIFACATREKTEFNLAEENARVKFERGIKLLDEERPAEAAQIFDKLLVDNPATEFDLVVTYNAGAAREAMGECRQAAEHYRQVARGSTGKFPRLEAMAFFRLSYAQECLGQYDKVLIALLDARRRQKALPEDVAKAELPARLAAGFARTGNRAEAEKYFKQALSGIKFLQVKYKDSRQLAEKLSETLYFMGRSYVSEAEFLKNPAAQVRSLGLLQLYLLQAAELGGGKWSAKAVDEVLGGYARVWRYTEQLDVPDQPDAGLKAQQKQRLKSEVLRETLRSVRVLRAQRLPSRQESGDLRRLFSALEEEERKITAVLSDLGPDLQLTPQAEKRQGLKAPGKIKGARETELEVEARRRATLPEKTKPTKEP